MSFAGPSSVLPLSPQALGLEMVSIPAGTFRGRALDDFQMSRTPVTNAQYARHVERFFQTPYVLLMTDPNTHETSVVCRTDDPEELFGPLWRPVREMSQDFAASMCGLFTLLELRKDMSPKKFDGPDQPVVRMSWFHAFEYCVSNGLFLPTDDEWSYAAGVGKRKKYATANGKLFAEDGRTKLAHFDEDATIDVNDPRYPDGPHGLRHMTGNVWQWTAWNPSEPRTHAYGKRGGSWCFYERDRALLSVHRDSFHPAYDPTVLDVGFRAVARKG